MAMNGMPSTVASSGSSQHLRRMIIPIQIISISLTLADSAKYLQKALPSDPVFFFFFPLNLYRLHLAALRVKMESFNAKSLPVQGDFEAEVRMDGCWELTLLRNSSGETSDKPDAPKITIQ